MEEKLDEVNVSEEEEKLDEVNESEEEIELVKVCVGCFCRKGKNSRSNF